MRIISGIVLYAFAICYPIVSIGQINRKHIKNSQDLKFKSVQLKTESQVLMPYTFRYANIVARGTGFFIKYKRQYYFISNYHVMTGRVWEDTTLFATPVQHEPNFFDITYYQKKGDKYITSTLQTKGEDGNRMFFSKPVENVRYVLPDLAFLKVESLPDSAVIAPINLKNSVNDWQLNPNTRLYIPGFSKRTWDDIYPYCDTVFTVGDSTFKNSDQFILVYNPPSMGGSSGSPVFVKFKKRMEFIGVFFAVVPAEKQHDYRIFFKYRYNSELGYTKPVGVIITRDFLTKTLDQLTLNH